MIRLYFTLTTLNSSWQRPTSPSYSARSAIFTEQFSILSGIGGAVLLMEELFGQE